MKNKVENRNVEWRVVTTSDSNSTCAIEAVLVNPETKRHVRLVNQVSDKDDG